MIRAACSYLTFEGVMSFSIEVKTEMFIRSSRLCCLCLKQCGVNIEAAHIIDEKKGGSNEFDNGIPACFDCHQKIGSYNDDHPKGNKFREAELKARRDRVYRLVDSGAIYAQIIAQRVHPLDIEARDFELESAAQPPAASSEAVRFLSILQTSSGSKQATAHKLALLNSQDRAYVLDELSRSATDVPQSIWVVGQIVHSTVFPKDEGIILTERIARAVTLYGDTNSKAVLLSAVPEDVFSSIYEGIRLAFFADVIEIINQDQFEDVNKLVPAAVDHISAIPPGLKKDFVFALLNQARSSSYQGAPAARRALRSLPDDLAKAAIDLMDLDFLFRNSQYEEVRNFAGRYQHLAEESKRAMFKDLSDLGCREFAKKYIPEDLY
jgi:hypothetical protein